jgi:quinol monooxygenase YgiN
MFGDSFSWIASLFLLSQTLQEFLMSLSKVLAGLSLLALAMLMMIATSDQAESNLQESKKTMLRHVVIFKFKDASSAQEVQKVVDGFRELKSKIPQIASFEFGTNNSPEGLNDGFTHCFLVTFKSEKDRDAYLPHPAHKAFVELLKPHLDKAMVIDYWAGE